MFDMEKGVDNYVESCSLHSEPTTTTENYSNDVDKLKEMLRQESRHHQETDKCYETLQNEYDELLKKFAEAENTIDKLRIGTRIKLYCDKPVPSNATEMNGFVDSRCKSVQMIALPQPQRALINRACSMPEQDFLSTGASPDVSPVAPDNDLATNLVTRIQKLQDDITTFQTSLTDDCYTTDEQESVYNLLRKEYDDVREHLKRKEEGRCRSETLHSRLSDDFAGANSLQTEVYRLGLRLEEIREEIDDQRRSRRSSLTSNEENDLTVRCDDNTDGSKEEGSLLHTNGHQPGSLSPNNSNILERYTDTGSLISQQHHHHQQQQQQQQQRRKSEGSLQHNQSANCNDGFEEKYLSRSLDVPVVDNKATAACSLDTEDKVGSWLSRESHIASPKRPARSSTASQQQRADSTHHQARLRFDVDAPEKSADNSKLTSPDGGIGKISYTMNSTEDSGFLEADTRSNTKPRMSHHRGRSSSDDMKFNHRYYNQQEGSIYNATDQNNNLYGLAATTDGGEYRNRLNSLRNFIDSRRHRPSSEQNSTSTTRNKNKKTPKSWVRGATSSSLPLHHLSSHSSSICSDQSDGSYAPSPLVTTTNNNNNNNNDNKNENDGKIRRRSKSNDPSQRSTFSKNSSSFPLSKSSYRSASFHSNSHRGVNSHAQQLDNGAYLHEERPIKPEMLQSLQEEIHGVRDLVLDLKSSLHNSPQPVHNPPRVATSSLSSKKSALKTNRSNPSFDTRNSSATTASKRNSQIESCDDVMQEQINMFGKLNDTIERLSSKLQHIEQKDRISLSSSSDSEDFEEINPKVSFHDEHFGSMASSMMTQNTSLHGLNNKVDSLYKRLNDVRNDAKKLKHSRHNKLLEEQTRLVASMNEKIHKMETSLKAEESITAPPADLISSSVGNGDLSSRIPVYIETCPVCGGFGAHSHGSLVFEGLHSPRALQSRSRDRSVFDANQEKQYDSFPTTPTKSKTSRHTFRNSSRSNKDFRADDYEENLTTKQFSPSRDASRSGSPNVIHHYHSFCGATVVNDGSRPNECCSHSALLPNKSLSRDTSTKDLQSKELLYDSISGATMAAKRMENLSKKMLSTIATDLFNARDLSEY